MKLYFSPGTCSLAPHIVFRETKLPFDLVRSEEHTSELQSRFDLVCRLLLEKKKSLYRLQGPVHDSTTASRPRQPASPCRPVGRSRVRRFRHYLPPAFLPGLSARACSRLLVT